MAWTVKVAKIGNSHVVQLQAGTYGDGDLLSTEANRLANQLLIAAAEAVKLNNPPKAFYRG